MRIYNGKSRLSVMVGSLNMISVAFMVLFVGLGVDFGIQFSVRYRSERHKTGDLQKALVQAAEYSAVPLSLAAMSTTAGFLSFLPTSYKGISELGEIAGVGMAIAFFTSITVLPGLLKLLNPAGEKEPLGYAFLAPVDHFLEKHRIGIIVGTIGVALGLKALFLVTTVAGVTGLWPAILADTGATVLVTLNALRLLRRSNS